MIRIQVYQNKKYFCVADILKAIGSKNSANRFLKATPENQYRKFTIATKNGGMFRETVFATAAALIPLLQNTGTVKSFEFITYLQAETGIKIDAPKAEPQPDGIFGELVRYAQKNIRFIYEDGVYWFAAMDICEILELLNHRQACSDLPDEYKKVGCKPMDGITATFDEIKNVSKAGNPNILFINEDGITELVLVSQKEAAKHFRRWLIKEIFPKLKSQGVAFVSEEREIDYFFETAKNFADLIATAEIVNDFENQKRFKEDHKTQWVRRHFPLGKPGKMEFANFYTIRKNVYKLYSDKELAALTEEKLKAQGRGVLPKAVTRNNILWNEWYAPGSALPAAYRDMHGYLDLSDKEKARIDKEIRLIQAYAKRVGLYPCARGGAKLITAARESDEVATARLVKMYREQKQKLVK